MKVEYDLKLDFSDVLIRPKRSTLNSRSEVTLEREYTFVHSQRKWNGVPIMASNMDSIGTLEMFQELSKHKALTCLHKYVETKEIIQLLNSQEFIKERDELLKYLVISSGITDADWERLQETIEELRTAKLDIQFICIDVANGYMLKLHQFCKKVRETFPNITIIAGNVVTREMVEELIINGGVDIVKVGIGSGSVCTTRLQTGVGMPQLSAVVECADAAHGVNGHIISDGGAVFPGDVSKAFGGGADFVMAGSMFAGHDESAGQLIEENGQKFKVFYGMSSATAMKKYHGGVAKYRSSEGKTVKVPYRGPVSETIQSVLGGIRSTCTYVGASRLKDLPKCCSFMRVNNQVNNVYSSAKFKI